MLSIWLLAGVSAFLPFAASTSPWDALILRVPGNQGNWWHVLIGFPFFLAFPMIWLRLRALVSKPMPSVIELRLFWTAVGISGVGTVLVELPFLLNRAGTSEWQRLAVTTLGLGILVASSIFLFLRWRNLSAARACAIGLSAAYLANAGLCLVVYASAPGTFKSRLGWLATAILVWPMALDLIRPFGQQIKTSL
jgi:hypothetical protein